MNSAEAGWSQALATHLAGTQEYRVPHGRVDVLTARYSIEVDRLPKWHEGIGQAIHYAEETGKIPLLALIVPAGTAAEHASLLDEIDRVSLRSGVRIVLLMNRTDC